MYLANVAKKINDSEYSTDYVNNIRSSKMTSLRKQRAKLFDITTNGNTFYLIYDH